MTSAAGFGLATLTEDGTVLDAWFPEPELGAYSPPGTTRLAADDIPDGLAALCGPDTDRGVDVVAVRTVTGALEDAPTDTFDAYLRLHLLSHRLVEPHGLNLTGVLARGPTWCGPTTVRAELRASRRCVSPCAAGDR